MSFQLPSPSAAAALPLQERVDIIRSLFAKNLSPSPDDKLYIPSRDDGRTILVHVYQSKSRMIDGPCPVLVNLHGGGFILETHGWDELFARRVASKTNFTVLDVDYRTSPAHKFPAALHDTEDVIKWVLSRPVQFDSSRLSISGFSAGGNLALVASSALFPPGTFSHVITLYPVTDLATPMSQRTIPGTDDTEEFPWIPDTFVEAYLPAGVDKRGPLVSLSFTSGDCFLDNILVITAGLDVLAVEAEFLADKIRDAGRKNVVVRRIEGVAHAWDKSHTEPGSLGERAVDEAYDLAVEMLRTQ